ncbi:MAG TPA: decarboxylating 6-phosphogluconate dehydrogenase [Gemmataceae bacterium]|jgi:6-phosphogluconate dehydrogenase|nr:decarboxylating 6-phosphogluconate dehydrogenase [Gemmataceae bacterium]
MQLGMIGLGRMGGNMVLRLLRAGHDCVGYDRDQHHTQTFDQDEKKKAAKATSVADVVKQLKSPRAVWVMLPAGKITEDCVNELAGLLQSGDTIIDGGNTMFKDDVRRAAALKPKGLTYMDVGTSGGVWGLERGYCQMIGGDKAAFERLEPIFAALAPGGPGKTAAEKGYIHAGPAGAGHFVKMVHNGIEYGLMQAYAEGFEVLEKVSSDKVPAERRYDLDLHAISEVWRHGSVVSSWLLDLLELAFREDARLDNFLGYVPDSGEGRWTVEAAIEEDVPAYVLATSLFTRFRSRQHPAFADKVLSAMRKGFGDHNEVPNDQMKAAVEASIASWNRAFGK